MKGYERMLEKNLFNHGMGVEKLSEADFLVFLDDQILVDHYDMKEKIGDRYQTSKDAKKRLQNLAKYAKVEIRVNSGKVINWGDKSYDKGNKVYTRVHNYKWTVEEDDKIAEIPYVDVNEGDDFDTQWFVDRIHQRAEATKNHVVIPEDIKQLITLQEEHNNLLEIIEQMYREIEELEFQSWYICGEILKLSM